MSRIYFHTRDEGQAEIMGAERAHMGLLVSDIAATFLPSHMQITHPRSERIARRFFKSYSYRGGDTTYHLDEKSLALHMRVGGEDGVVFDERGNSLSSFSLLLNTILKIGNDALCLMARLHAQCEIHAYVEGPNRSWLADLVDEGRELGVMRSEMGWEALSALLRARDDAPVVTSYSVCDSFPYGLLDHDEDDEDDDGELHEADHQGDWDIAIERLRERSVQAELELKPDSLRGTFNHDRDLLQLFS